MKGRRTAVAVVVVAVLAVALAVAAAVALRPGGSGPGAGPLITPTDLPTFDREATGFPDATTTGVPDGVTLNPSGDVDVREDGAVIEGLDIDGCVDVRADDVTIRDSRITCARPTTAIRVFDGYSGLRVEDTEIDGTGNVSTAVGFAGYTLVRVNIHDVIDGPRMGSATALVDSWVHSLARGDGSHSDALQITGGSGIVVRHNTLQAYDEATGDLHNAAIMIGSNDAPVTDVLVEGNYLDGGNYTVNFRPDAVAERVVGRDNTFGPNFRYGPIARGDTQGVEWTDDPWASLAPPQTDG